MCLDFDVAIVGMGPVGATAALMLAEAGLRVVVVERNQRVYPLPRAVGMDGEVVRGFQAIGRAEEFVGLLQAVRAGDRAGFANAQRQWLFGQDYIKFGSNGWQSLSMFDQPELERYLHAVVAEHPLISCYLGCELNHFDNSEEAVRIYAKFADDGQQLSFSARFLLACDGAASSVRNQLDIPWHSLGYDQDWLVVDVEVNDKHTLNLDTVQVCDPRRLATYVAGKDPYRRWEFKLNPGETKQQMLEPAMIQSLLDDWTPRNSYEIRRSAVYQFHAATATRWRDKSVFLAGDAAHQSPPFLGQGMNAGLRDVFNLAWKIPMVLSGQADQVLLDSYQSERAPHAEDLVEWAVAIGELMEHMAATESALQQNLPAPKVPAQKHSAAYGQGRESPPLRDGILIVEQVSDQGSTGYLFQQPLVQDNAGYQFLLDQRLGKGFAIVVADDVALQLNSKSLALIDKLHISVSSIADLKLCRGRFDAVFEYANAVVVRPDRYVFGHVSQELNLDQLLARLASNLQLN